MDKKKLWDSHRGYTKEFSTTTRQLAFASIAVCWLLKPDGFEFPFTSCLTLSILTTVIYFFFDSCQYAFGAAVHYYLARKCEKENTNETPKNKKWDWPAYACLFLKSFSLAGSYVLIGIWMYSN